MPQFINSPYSSNTDGGIGSMLSSMGQAQFGDTARRALITQQMLEKERQNANAEPYAAALRDHNPSQAVYYGSLGGHTGQDLGAGNLAATAADAGANFRDPRLAIMALGAGHPASGTFPGLDTENAGRLDVTKQQGQNQIATEQNKPVTLVAPDGSMHLVPGVASAEHLINAGGYRLIPSMDQSIGIGNMPAAAPQAAPSGAPVGSILPGGAQIMPDASTTAPGAQPAQPAAPPPITGDSTPQSFSPASLPPQTKPVPAPVAAPTAVPAPGTPGGPVNSVDGVAKMIATYQMPPLSGQAMRTPSGMMVMKRVGELNPDYRAETYNMQNRGQTAFGTGPQGNVVRAFDVGISHLGTLGQLSDALGNGDVKLVNAARQMWQSQTGQAAPTNFAAAKDIVMDEVVKAVVGANGALGDREGAQRTVSAANSPEQLRGVINTYKTLMAGQLKGYKHQYEVSTGQKDFESHLSPETAKELLGDQGGAQTQGGGENWVRGPDGKLVRQ